MSENIHKYLCVFCKTFIFGATAARLATNLNDHNNLNHSQESNTWTGSGITYSSHYTGPAQPNANWKNDAEIEVEHKPRPEYMVPYGTALDKRMTPAGRKVLEKLGVKW